MVSESNAQDPTVWQSAETAIRDKGDSILPTHSGRTVLDEMTWTAAVYDLSGADAYRSAVAFVGDGADAAMIVEQAFRSFRQSSPDDMSVEAAGVAIVAATCRLALELRHRVDPAKATPLDPRHGLSPEAASPRGAAHPPVDFTAVRPDLFQRLRPVHRAALELATFEALTVHEIAERMQFSVAAIHRLLGEALHALRLGLAPSPAVSLAEWRNSLHRRALVADHDPLSLEYDRHVAHAWLGYQEASGALSPNEVILLSGADRRYVAASANAARVLGRRTLIGLRIDDITPPANRAALPEVWESFLTHGSMEGDYDCDRPGQEPIRLRFRAYAGRPLPGLQVSYLRPVGLET